MIEAILDHLVKRFSIKNSQVIKKLIKIEDEIIPRYLLKIFRAPSYNVRRICEELSFLFCHFTWIDVQESRKSSYTPFKKQTFNFEIGFVWFFGNDNWSDHIQKDYWPQYLESFL